MNKTCVRSTLEHELDQVHSEILRMGSLVESAMSPSRGWAMLEALFTGAKRRLSRATTSGGRIKTLSTLVNMLSQELDYTPELDAKRKRSQGQTEERQEPG